MMKLYVAGVTAMPGQDDQEKTLRLIKHRLMSYYTVIFDRTCELKVFEIAIILQGETK